MPTYYILMRYTTVCVLLPDGVRFPRQHSFRNCDPSGRFASSGHGRHFGSIRQGLLIAGQKEEIRDESSSENAEPCIQRNVPVQGIMSR